MTKNRFITIFAGVVAVFLVIVAGKLFGAQAATLAGMAFILGALVGIA